MFFLSNEKKNTIKKLITYGSGYCVKCTITLSLYL